MTQPFKCEEIEYENWEDRFEPKLGFVKCQDFYATPKRATKNSVGYDVFASHRKFLPPNNKFYKINIGIKWVIPEGYHGKYVLRSSLGMNPGLKLGSCTPIIDSDFYEEAGFYVSNPPAPGKCGYIVQKGDRIAQFILCKSYTPQLVEMSGSDIDEKKSIADRTGGFGSTGR
jgi:dUTP pyrophosphatase